jgi:predicted ATP-grasp superfamily ATP-dependent carboligase
MFNDSTSTGNLVTTEVSDAAIFGSGRLLVVAFEGWNDAGEAASGAVDMLREQLELEKLSEIDPEDYFDYQFNRPTIAMDDDGNRSLTWPTVSLHGPTHPMEPGSVAPAVEPLTADAAGNNADNIYLLTGTEPSRGWKVFTSEIIDHLDTHQISAVVFLGAMLADVPHTRPISVFASSENAHVRESLGLERSTYEGPVGILSALSIAAEKAGVPTVSIWASVPHYVHNAPSPKATLALIDKLEEIVNVVIPRGTLVEDATAWENGIDTLAAEDEDMTSYIEGLERARDTVDSPEASGESIAREFEKYLRRSDDGRPEGGKAGEGR